MFQSLRLVRCSGIALIAAAVFAVAAPGSAEAAKWKAKPQAKVAKSQAGASGDAASAELPTGALVSHGPGGEAIGKDCFVVKKRALVPGAGYMIRRSTFCN